MALGRRDSQTANQSAANTSLPAPFMNLDVLTKLFSDHGFTTQELVALSGQLSYHYFTYSLVFITS